MRVGRHRSWFTRSLWFGVALLFARPTLGDRGTAPAARTHTERSAPSGYTLWLHTSPNADDCPSALELRRRISERLGHDPFTDGTQSAAAMHVSFTRVGATYHATLALNAADGATLERRFEDRADNCRHLAEALVLGGTLLLEGGTATANAADTTQPTPRGVAERPPPNGDPASSVPNAVTASSASVGVTEPPAPNVVAAPPQTKSSERSAASKVANEGRIPSAFSLGPAFSYGVVSDRGIGWGMSVAGAFYPFGAWGVKVGADYSIGDSIQRGVTQYQFSQTSGFVEAVVLGRLHPRLHVVPELGVMVGALHAAVLTHDPVDPGDFFFVGMRAGAILQWRCFGPLTVGAGTHLRLPFNRQVFHAFGLSEPVWQQPLLGLSAEVVLGLHFD